MLPSNWYENSVCNGCEYGERITAGVFCSELQELVPVGYVGCKAERDYYEEIDKMENGITLTELAHELRKIFKFKYLVAYGSELYGYRVRAYLLKPKYIPIGGFWFNATRGNDALLDISFSDLMCELDLSEYKDTDGNIDYSKCIVEVSDDIG